MRSLAARVAKVIIIRSLDRPSNYFDLTGSCSLLYTSLLMEGSSEVRRRIPQIFKFSVNASTRGLRPICFARHKLSLLQVMLATKRLPAERILRLQLILFCGDWGLLTFTSDYDPNLNRFLGLFSIKNEVRSFESLCVRS